MKKAILGVFLCLSLAVLGFSQGFSIKVNGGANFLMGGDYNQIVQGVNDFWHASSGVTVSSDLKKLSMGWNFGAEFIYNFTDQMGLGLGVGYITASNESTIAMSLGAATQSYTYRPSASVIPITLNFHYFLPIGDTMKIHFSAGPGLYISTFTFENQWELPILLIDLTQIFSPDGVKAFGFQGGLGLEIDLSPGISLCVDVLGRMANMSGLTGGWTVAGTIFGIPVSDSGTGTLYYYESGGYPSGTIDDTLPSGSGISSAREASVSLSGVCALVGLKINI